MVLHVSNCSEHGLEERSGPYIARDDMSVVGQVVFLEATPELLCSPSQPIKDNFGQIVLTKEGQR